MKVFRAIIFIMAVGLLVLFSLYGTDNSMITNYVKTTCDVHWWVLIVTILSIMFIVLFRRSTKKDFLVLGCVAVMSIILCFYGDCKADWIIAIAGTIILEVMDIVFVRKYNQESN